MKLKAKEFRAVLLGFLDFWMDTLKWDVLYSSVKILLNEVTVGSIQGNYFIEGTQI